ncbi:MAG: hypothetical protein LR011_09735 [Verrucomicrobia bacterium]|nr:hypothetical protein [Verrucomicrobiota bacterium]
MWIIFAGMLLLFATIIVVSVLNDKKRREDLAAIALTQGLEFVALPDSGPILTIMQCELGSIGRNHRIKNALIGQYQNCLIAIFDFTFVTGSGKNSSRHSQTVFMAPAHTHVPEFRLKPENIFHQIGDRFSKQDIDLDAYPEFSRQYVLKGPDHAAILSWMTPNRIRHLESWKGISIESLSGNVIYFRHGKSLLPQKWLDFVDECLVFHRLI